MTPVKTAVWWIEYAIRNRGAEHLKYKGADVPFIEYYLIDIICVHLAAAALIVYLLKKVIASLRATPNSNVKTSNKKVKSQ